MTARAVCLGPSGVIRGQVTATSADVSGSLTDEIEIKQLLIVRATGRIEGNVRYGEIQLEKGGILTGELSPMDDYRPTALPSSPKRVLGPGAAAPEISPIEREAFPVEEEAPSGAGSAEGAGRQDAGLKGVPLFGAPRLRRFTRHA